MNSTAALRTSGLSRTYGALRAVSDVSVSVDRGERHAIIGPNGAGKSTFFKLISGVVRPTEGEVWLDGRDVTHATTVKRSQLGMGQTFQHASIFLESTVAENVAIAAQKRWGRPSNPWRRVRSGDDVDRRVDQVLETVGLERRRSVLAGSLSHGERQQLQVGIALAPGPRILLFDEPTAGMSGAETQRFVELVASLDPEITILIIEHDLGVVFELATRVSVLHLGGLLASGTPDEIRANEAVRAAYLGGSNHDLGGSGA